MPNYTKTNPVGIDTWVQNIQTAIYTNFLPAWNLADSEWNSYGRLYRNFDNEGKEYLPYPFQTGTEYENPPLFNDNITLQTFFDISEDIKIGESCQSTARVTFYCFADLVKLFGDTGDREDETLMQQIDSFVQEAFGFHLHSKRVGIKAVMRDYNGYAKENIMASDKQPLFAFAIEFEINEYYTCYANSVTQNYIQPTPLLIPTIRNSAKGIDQWIERCQIYLYNYLLGIFDGSRSGYGTLTEAMTTCYGRCYRQWSRIKGKIEYIPQIMIKGTQEYVNILFEDTVALQCFFDVGETMREDDIDLLTYSEIHLYVFCDLSKLYPDAATRMDEEFIILMLQFMMEQSGFDRIYNVSRGTKSILSDFNGLRIRMNQKANMQPFLCFRIDARKYYDESFNNCPILNIT